MNGKMRGYARANTQDQDLSLQINDLKKADAGNYRRIPNYVINTIIEEVYMNQNILFQELEKLSKFDLLKLLQDAFLSMDTSQKREVFECHIPDSTEMNVNGSELLADVKLFYKNSLRGDYYASFNINSKNFSDIPEETDEWFEELASLLEQTTALTNKNKHNDAVKCFEILFKLLSKLDEDIVFADELGSWMLPGDHEKFNLCYIQSAAAVLQPEEFANHMLVLLEEDSYSSFCNKVYQTAIKIANAEQKSALMHVIEKNKTRYQSDA